MTSIRNSHQQIYDTQRELRESHQETLDQQRSENSIEEVYPDPPECQSAVDPVVACALWHQDESLLDMTEKYYDVDPETFDIYIKEMPESYAYPPAR